VFWSVVVGAVATALAGYYAFESSLPDCGPPRNTFLGQIYWLVPIALIGAQSGVLGWAGIRTGRSLIVTIAVVVVAAVVALLGGTAIFLHFFAAGNCGE
jgi:hypothetical protein